MIGQSSRWLGAQKEYVSHNVLVLIYHFVLSIKYRRVVIDKHVDEIIAATREHWYLVPMLIES